MIELVVNQFLLSFLSTVGVYLNKYKQNICLIVTSPGFGILISHPFQQQ